MEVSGKKILVVEDEEINFLYIDILIKRKYPELEIFRAKNGQEAIDICEIHNNIALVFMDLKMPIMNGYDATSKIKELNKDLPIIALTAYCSPKDKAHAIEIGFDEYLTKPIDKKKFFSIINDNLSSQN